MRARSRLLLPLVLLVAGCGTTGAPPGLLPKVDEAASDPYGGWIQVSLREGATPRRLEGELIASESETLWMLPAARDWSTVTWSDSLIAIPWSAVERIKVAGWQPETTGLALWGTVGSLSTISHGVGLVFSFPIWIVSTVAAVRGENQAAVVEGRPDRWRDEPARSWTRAAPPWTELRARARFPQGLPPGTTRLRARPRDVPRTATPAPGRAP